MGNKKRIRHDISQVLNWIQRQSRKVNVKLKPAPKQKSITIRFEFPAERNGIEVTHNEIEEIINGCLFDMESDFSKEVTYTITERK